MGIFTKIQKTDDLPSFFMSTVPKSGTNYLKQILLGMPNVTHSPLEHEYYVDYFYLPEFKNLFYRLGHIPSNAFGAGHVYYSPEFSRMLKRLNMKHIFLYRDLRDVVVSFTYFVIDKYPYHPMYEYLVQLPTQKDRYIAMIKGVDTESFQYPGIADWIRPFYRWINDPDTFSISFEDIGLSEESRRQVIHKIAEYLWRDLKPPLSIDEMVERMEANIDPKRSFTFRSGKIGDWKNEFDEDIKQVFKKTAGHILIETGYEKDNDW
ncbi:sulfotransferase domain-containing protein [Fodinisporobacter ferrooxydans]|uniref:Sulfotransferase domain-containing protein n=1 Tax=Fodinisporobacter ferrooxydans TaxID=2901836 RepID=A0ABY4CJL1_9BACL|nr:sulfotransferase domain-containing protein [Alicyclobacillaceae bacterium MYW30-H2]